MLLFRALLIATLAWLCCAPTEAPCFWCSDTYCTSAEDCLRGCACVGRKCKWLGHASTE